MRKIKRFTIEGHDQEIELRELSLRETIELAQSFQSDTDGAEEEGKTDIVTLKNFLDKHFLPKVSNLTIEKLKDYSPSEIEEIFGKFKEVNKSFFGMAKAAGLTTLFAELKQAILSDFSKMLVGLSSEAIARL